MTIVFDDTWRIIRVPWWLSIAHSIILLLYYNTVSFPRDVEHISFVKKFYRFGLSYLLAHYFNQGHLIASLFTFNFRNKQYIKNKKHIHQQRFLN